MGCLFSHSQGTMRLTWASLLLSITVTGEPENVKEESVLGCSHFRVTPTRIALVPRTGFAMEST